MSFLTTERLSATDISALASMKNVAKCDTWCELQNPVNHRVFERKLRPKPSGRGHVCLGVTHRVAPTPASLGEGRTMAPRVPRHAAGPNADPVAAKRRDVRWRTLTRTPGPSRSIAPRHQRPPWDRRTLGGTELPAPLPPLRPQVRRDYPLSLSISISGGEETYKDSPSNGERTGKSPALESGGPAVRIVVWRSVLRDGPGPSPLEGGAGEGESPVVARTLSHHEALSASRVVWECSPKRAVNSVQG